MNWMDLTKTADFWKAWQDAANRFNPVAQPAADPVKDWWQQQERFWKEAMDKTSTMFGQQPDVARQWQDMQSTFLKQWTELAQASLRQNPAMANNATDWWKQVAEQTQTWYADAFRNKLPEQLRPHFQSYLDMYKMFNSQWENIQGMIRHGAVEPKMIWQMVNPAQYADAVGKVMSFKPMKDLDEVTRQANRFFEQLRATAMKLFPATEEQVLEMDEAFRAWSNQQSDHFFPFLTSLQEVMRNNMEPYFHVSGDNDQADVLRSLKDMQFTYLAYLHHTARLQKMVLDAGARVLPDMMQEARDGFLKDNQLPEFDPFFRTYMDRLEDAIVETMHSDDYARIQNEVLESGSKSKVIFDELMEKLLKDWPFMTKREADDLAKETTLLRRRVRDLESRLESLSAPGNGKAASTAPATEKKTADELIHDVIARIGKPKGDPDDLKEIKGIGSKLEKLLLEMGIRTFAQIAKMDVQTYELIDELLPAFKGRAQRDDWSGQAKHLIQTQSLV